MRHFSGPDSTLAVGPDGSLLFPSNPRTGGIPNRHRPGGHRSPMPERLIWSYIIQLSSALRTVHASGLACRVIDPSKILLIGNSRWASVCKPVSRRWRLEPKLRSWYRCVILLGKTSYPRNMSLQRGWGWGMTSDPPRGHRGVTRQLLDELTRLLQKSYGQPLKKWFKFPSVIGQSVILYLDFNVNYKWYLQLFKS